MRIDILMLRWMAGEAASGQYAAAVRLSELGYFIPLIAAASVQPLLVRAHQGDAGSYLRALQKYFDLSTLAAYVLALPTALLAPWIIRLAYGVQYAEAGAILAVHAWAVVFVFLGVARSQFLINAGFTRFSLVATVAGAAMNVSLNLLLIPRWSGMGAALATVISYAVSAWLTSFFSPKVRHIGWMQTKAMLAPFTAWRYLCKP
jgi:O-antigen/teichoic acid export membrane protein